MKSEDAAHAAHAAPGDPGAGGRRSTLPSGRKSTVAKVSHTLSVSLAERLEEFAFFQRVSESAVIEFALRSFFELGDDDTKLGDLLRREGAGRRRKAES